MKLFRVLCVLALVALFAGAAYAETQSVKVSGDLTVRGIARHDYDYRGSISEGGIFGTDIRTGVDLVTGAPDETQSWIMSTTEIQIDADMTDNVSTCVRLVNERDWGVRGKLVIDEEQPFNPMGEGGYLSNPEDFNVGVDLAYVTLKEFVYCPLTLTIGRQDLWFGRGFIVGANNMQKQHNALKTVIADNIAAGLIAAGGDDWPLPPLTGYSNIMAPEYSTINSFDAIKAVLDYDPWTITGVYAKIWENAIGDNDDCDLYGINVGYKFDQYKAEAEMYWFYKKDNQLVNYGMEHNNSNDVHTIGLRGSFDPIDVITIALEGAYQAGSYTQSREQNDSCDRSAWAIDAMMEWRYLSDKFSWKPKLDVEYIWYSGQTDSENPNDPGGTYRGWDPMFRGKCDTAMREYMGQYYFSYDYSPRGDYYYSSADASYQNQHQVLFTGTITPVESLTLGAKYALFWNQERYRKPDDGLNPVRDGTEQSGNFIGQEIDLTADWAYTEDVSFGLLAAWFIPGEVYYNADKCAQDLVGSVKVNF